MKKRFAILSASALLALVSLAGCSSCPECEVCEEPTDNPSDNPGDNPGETPVDPDEPGTEEPDPSEGLIDAADSPWGAEITDLMVKNLGGAVLPLVDLGEGEIDAQFVKSDENENYRSYVELVGGTFLVSHLEDAISEYKDHYWDALMVGDEFYASNNLINVEVEVGQNENGLFELKAFYNEPFNSEDATSWDEVTSLLISEHFGRFEIPFVYLGTVNYDSTIAEDGSLLVTGGTWNDQVVGLFKSSFASRTVTDDTSVLTTKYATTTIDGNVLNATLSQVNNRAQLSVSLTETFDPTNQTDWSSEVKSQMQKSLNNTILPYVYLGSVYPTIDASGTGERAITLVGKNWEDSILTAADAAFKADGWASSAGEGTITFTKDNDIDSYEVVIEKNADGAPVLRASREEMYNESTLTDYTEEIKSAFNTLYGEEMSGVIPFLYLGTAFPTLKTDVTSEHPEDVSKMVIIGGKYDAKILENFKSKFKEGWYSAIDNSEKDAGSNYADDYGDVLAVALKSTSEYTYKVGLFTLGTGEDKTTYLEINRSVNTGTSATTWSEESLANLKTVVGDGVKIPHFDVGRDTMEFVFNDEGSLEIEFSADATTFWYRIYSAIDAFTKDGWELTLAHNDTYYDDEAWISSLHATRDFNGKKMSVDIGVSASYYYRFSMSGSISLQETYDETKETTGSWSDDIKNEISERYNIELPYIYLGSDYPYIYENEEEETFKIIGNVLTKEVFANAKEVLTTNGFLVDSSASSEMCVVATKENGDGNIVTVIVDYEDGKPYITFELTEVFKPDPTITEWDDATKQTLSSALPEGVTLPYMYLGTKEPTSSVETFTNRKMITIIGGNWNNAVIETTKEYLAKSAFTVSTSASSLTAYTILEDNTAVRMQLSENYDQIELNIYVDSKPTDADDTFKAWADFPANEYSGEKPIDVVNQYLGVELPTFVPTALVPTDAGISISSPYNEYSNQFVSVSTYSSYFDPYYIYMAMDELERLGYTVTFNPFASETMPGLSASKVVENGTIMVSLLSSYGEFDDEENGIKISALYLPDQSNFNDVTAFEESDKIAISDSLAGLELPYVNLGCAKPRINTSSGEVTITGYNYSGAIINSIKETYQTAGWTMYDTYVVSGGRALKTVGGYLTKDGHTYVLTVTPSLSSAVYGGGSFSTSSITTKLEIVMA